MQWWRGIEPQLRAEKRPAPTHAVAGPWWFARVERTAAAVKLADESRGLYTS